MTTRLVAKERFFYAGRNVEKDEEFEAEDQDVALLTYHHTPKATTLEVTPQKKKAAKAVVEQRDDLTAEDRLISYKRRDLKSEE